MPKQIINIAGKLVGQGQPPYLIAEMSGNHNGSLENAIRILEAAATAGVDAVKLQTYRPDTMTIDSDKGDFRIDGGPWDGYTLYQLYEWAQTPWEWHEELFRRGKELGLTVFSTPFDESAVDYLEQFDPPVYKIASFEATDLQLIERVATTGKPLLMSTGMADLAEINAAVLAARQAGCKDLVLLHCVSGYPTPPEELNLLTLQDLERRFHIIPGLSDHTLTTATAIAGVALGAKVIEKHITLSRSDGGPDATFSLEPTEWKELCESARLAWKSLGTSNYATTESEKANLRFRRSLYVVSDIAEGDKFTPDNVRRIRPGYGMAPRHYQEVIGRRANCELPKGTALQWSHIAD